jgi:hypothetical protein
LKYRCQVTALVDTGQQKSSNKKGNSTRSQFCFCLVLGGGVNIYDTFHFSSRSVPFYYRVLHYPHGALTFPRVDDGLVDALLHQSPLSPFLLACNQKKGSSQAITFADPAPQRSLKSILIFSGVYFCLESLFFQILHLAVV